MLWTKRAHQYIIFQIFEYSNESSPNFSCYFWNHKARVYLNFTSLFSVMKDNSSVFFLAHTTYTLNKSSPSNSDFWVVSALVKIHQIPHVILKPQVSFSLNLASFFNVIRDNSSVFFLAETLCDFYRRSPSKYKISYFQLLRWNFTKFVFC